MDEKMTYKKYLKQTEYAVKQLFQSLKFYKNILKDVTHPGFESINKDCNNEYQKWFIKNKKAIKNGQEKVKEYLGYTDAQGIICGSILQISFMGINSFSQNSSLPSQCIEICPTQRKALKFCIGKLICDLPIGIIIYAARNQYNHMDEETYNNVTTKVFDHIATYDTKGKYKIPFYDINNPDVINYANNILYLFEWREYEDYYNDMKDMIL